MVGHVSCTEGGDIQDISTKILVAHGKPGDLPRFELAHEVLHEISDNAKEVDMKELMLRLNLLT
jgi:hypothetical protein